MNSKNNTVHFFLVVCYCLFCNCLWLDHVCP